MGATTLSAPATATYPQKYVGRFGPVGSSVYTARSTEQGKKAVVTIVAGSSSYATGGDSIDISKLGLSHVEAAYVVADSAITAASGLADGYAPVFDLTTDTAPKLVLYTSGGQVSATTNVSSREYVVMFVGR
jgi:hypothetical protein